MAYANWGYLPYPSTAGGFKLGIMDMNQQPPQARGDAEAKGNAPRPKHDSGQRRLFSHPRMVADLLRLLPENLARGLDLGTLRRLPAEHVGKALHSRRSDMPWRIDLLSSGLHSSGSGVPRAESPSAEGPLVEAPVSPSPSRLEHPGSCLLLLEFQSSVDPRMAERMQEYAALLRGDLSREGKVRDPGGGLPALLPLVVYNGRRPWTAPVDLGSAPEGLPAGLAKIQPKFEYVLLEVRGFGPNAQGLRADSPSVNFALAQFALENASAEDLPAAMAAVAGWLKAEGELELAESFAMWIEGVLEPHLDVRLPSLTRMMEEPPMLAETLDEWAEEKFQLGRIEGIEHGRAEGVARGRAEGIEHGRAEGMARGRAEGIERERALLLHLAQRRFGADVGQALSELIKGMDDADRLMEVGDLVVDCATGRELLDRAGRG